MCVNIIQFRMRFMNSIIMQIFLLLLRSDQFTTLHMLRQLSCRHVCKITCGKPPQIAKFMGPTWGPPGSCRPQMGPCWPHEPCYQGLPEPVMNPVHWSTYAYIKRPQFFHSAIIYIYFVSFSLGPAIYCTRNICSTLRPRQNDRWVADNIVKLCLSFKKMCCIFIQASLKCIPKDPFENKHLCFLWFAPK